MTFERLRARSLAPLLGVLAAATVVGSTGQSPALADAGPSAAVPPITPLMRWLGDLPASPGGEDTLAALFARGTATYVPIGVGTGYPVLFHQNTELDALASQLWGGKTFRVYAPGTHPNGDPFVHLDNKILKTEDGAVFDVFDAEVTRSALGDLAIGRNARGERVAPPRGVLSPIFLSFLKEPVVIDDQPSVVLNYFGDTTLPVIRRILDEIREVDGARCKGLFLGRAHARRCTSFDCGEAPSLIDSPEHPTFETRFEWTFWTYFLLSFQAPDGACDLAPAVRGAVDQLRAAGVATELPALP